MTDLAERVRKVVTGSWSIFGLWCGLATLLADRLYPRLDMFWLGFVIVSLGLLLAMSDRAELERLVPPNA